MRARTRIHGIPMTTNLTEPQADFLITTAREWNTSVSDVMRTIVEIYMGKKENCNAAL